MECKLRVVKFDNSALHISTKVVFILQVLIAEAVQTRLICASMTQDLTYVRLLFCLVI